ncbi:hypothetical protein [Ornithinimicrobium sediminis]|uniref:hypothetical protein n=1 Tax=Ornithinimicrobium sediminis TaxID=2904603 RepID=UPI001E533DAE|nr:hypothetical protein [Ornithinimicrobium sediminis]MCE0486969.1 hypothetical protein [Ornithinimicrobium sediminis]
MAEDDLLPDREVFRIAVAGLLGFLLMESIARVLTLVRFYRRDEATMATTEGPDSPARRR